MDIKFCIQKLLTAVKTGLGMLGLFVFLCAIVLSAWRLGGDVEFLVNNWETIKALLKDWGPLIGFLVAALLVGKSIYDTSESGAQESSGFVPTAEPASATISEEQSVELARHYSSRDRDNIADLFQELRTIMDKHASALHGELMKLQFTWPQLPRKTPGDTLNFDTTIKRLKLIRNDAALLDNHIFTEWPKRNKGYDKLLKAIIAFRKPNVFSDLWHCCDRVIPAAESAHSAYVKAPNQTHQMAVIMGAIVEPLVVCTAGLNGWLADTERRIDEQEKLILNRS